MEDKLFLAWAAGFFDGEGCVMVSERLKQTIYHLRTSVTQQDPTALHLLKQRFGGNVTPDKTAAAGDSYARKKGQTLVWRWKAESSVAYNFLRAIEPFVVVKADQVRIALTWPEPTERYNGRGVPEEVRSARREIMHRLRDVRTAQKVYLEVAGG